MLRFCAIFMVIYFTALIGSSFACPTLSGGDIKCTCIAKKGVGKPLGHLGIKIDQKFKAFKGCLVCTKDCGHTLEGAIKKCHQKCKKENEALFNEQGYTNYYHKARLDYNQGKGNKQWHAKQRDIKGINVREDKNDDSDIGTCDNGGGGCRRICGDGTARHSTYSSDSKSLKGPNKHRIMCSCIPFAQQFYSETDPVKLPNMVIDQTTDGNKKRCGGGSGGCQACVEGCGYTVGKALDRCLEYCKDQNITAQRQEYIKRKYKAAKLMFYEGRAGSSDWHYAVKTIGCEVKNEDGTTRIPGNKKTYGGCNKETNDDRVKNVNGDGDNGGWFGCAKSLIGTKIYCKNYYYQCKSGNKEDKKLCKKYLGKKVTLTQFFGIW